MTRAEKYGHWTGTYELRPIPIPDWSDLPWYKRAWKRATYTALYEFLNDKVTPLTLMDRKGALWRPDNHLITDMGSVPKRLQGLIPWLFAKDLWLRDYILHDSAYKMGGLWASDGTKAFVFVHITRAQADNLLSMSIKASGGGSFSSGPIWLGVRVGGGGSWNKGDLRNTLPPK